MINLLLFSSGWVCGSSTCLRLSRTRYGLSVESCSKWKILCNKVSFIFLFWTKKLKIFLEIIAQFLRLLLEDNIDREMVSGNEFLYKNFCPKFSYLMNQFPIFWLEFIKIKKIFFSIVAAHSDSPCLRVKPNSKLESEGCLQVGFDYCFNCLCFREFLYLFFYI